MLGEQVGVDDAADRRRPDAGRDRPPRDRRAARLGGYDVVILDTAGRTHIDEPLMAEMAEIEGRSPPHEILLVADALTGQDAVNIARAFDERVGITGIVLTRVDGDGRGGAALSMRAVTGKPIKLIGTGEKMDALEEFHPARIADRILGMGDIVSPRREGGAETIDAEKARADRRRRCARASSTSKTCATSSARCKKIGGMGGLMGMMPGIAKMKKPDRRRQHRRQGLRPRQIAIINSMTQAERRNPDVLKACRKKRVAAGSGAKVRGGQQAS